jgi:hypothetical protein
VRSAQIPRHLSVIAGSATSMTIASIILNKTARMALLLRQFEHIEVNEQRRLGEIRNPWNDPPRGEKNDGLLVAE